MKLLLIAVTTLCTISLCGCSNSNKDALSAPTIQTNLTQEVDKIEDKPIHEVSTDTDAVRNPFFFKEGTSTAKYKARFTFLGAKDLPTEVDLLVDQKSSLENGTLYQLKLDIPTEFNGREYDGWDRFDLGYFYVQEEKISLSRENDILNNFETEAEILDESYVVCQKDEMKDLLEENEKGWHEYILVNENRRAYHSYNTLTDTGFYEVFTWEEEKGLVSYRSGFGAEKDGIGECPQNCVIGIISRKIDHTYNTA